MPESLTFDETFTVTADNPLLRGHVVHGRHLLPGVGYVDLVLQVLSRHGWQTSSVELRNLTILAPPWWPPPGSAWPPRCEDGPPPAADAGSRSSAPGRTPAGEADPTWCTRRSPRTGTPCPPSRGGWRPPSPARTGTPGCPTCTRGCGSGTSSTRD
ncbi:polyketide synthase dehydratase domain-containing protein [Streptomyces sp. GKU 257-1]|nr:polyketide synthase dehydratase domain-containing protein [Streptomyces sp. GKU 257-1]